MIKVGYKTTDNTDVTYQECSDTGEANTVIATLRDSKAGDSSIRYFYLEVQTTDTEWEKYAFIDAED
tara:strand:+ start:1003 stop:1203 length:201 start_codon:yes stop_codon:yes gene_type:complete